MSRPAASVLAALVAALAAGCASEGAPAEGPVPLAVAPTSGPEGQPVAVVVTGEGFRPVVHTDFGDGGASTIDARFSVRLGSAPLRDVALREDGTLAATVPETLPPGTYDLTVVDPEGREGVLPAAYRVLGASDEIQLVAAYVVAAIGPQEAGRPFEVSIAAVDATGAAVAGYAGPVAISDLGGTAVPALAGLFVNGRWTGTVEIRAPLAGDVLRVEDGLGRWGESAPFDVAPAAAARLAFTTAARAVEAGVCSEEIGIALEDAYGLPTVAAAPVAVSLLPSAADVTLFADPACAIPLGSPALAAGEGTLSVHARATRAGTGVLDASAAGLEAASQALSVAPGAPAALAFVTSPRVASAGACSDAVTVELRDAWGNPTAGVGSVSLAVAPDGAIALFSDGACATPASSVALGADARATFRFRGEAAATVQVTASALGLSASQAASVVPEGGASRLAFVSPTRSTAAGACSAELVVETQDSFGNAVPGGGIAVAFASAPDRTFHLDPGCADPPVLDVLLAPGESQARAHVRGTVAQVAPVDASAAGLTSASQDAEVVAAAPERIEFATSPRTPAAGACSAVVTVRLRDAYGNVAASTGTPLALAASPAGGLAFHLDAACGGAVTAVPFPAGQTQASFHVTGTAAGEVAVSVSAGLAADATQVETILPATRDRLALLAGGGQTVTAGGCAGPVTLESQDAFGNRSGTGIDRTIALSAPGAPAGLELFAGASCVGAGASTLSLALPTGVSQAVFSYRGRTAGPATASAAVAGWTAVPVPLAIAAGPRDRLVVLSGGSQAVEAGSCSGPVTLQTRDAFDNASGSGGPVTIALDVPGAPPDLGLFDGAGCGGDPVTSLALADGVSEAVFSFRGTTAWPFEVDARVGGWPSLAVPEAVAAGPAAAFAWSAIPTPQYQGVPFAVTLTALDAWDNVATSFAGTATFSSASAVTLECAAACGGTAATSPFAAGVWAGQIDVRPGATGVSVTATSGGASGASAPFDVVGAGPRSAPLARITATPPVVTSGQSVILDAGGSVDYQSLDDELVVSWDWTGTAGGAGGDAGQGWTAWGDARSVAHVYACGGPAACTYFPRAAVRDPDGDVGYATVRVVVLPSGADLCVVETPADVDDGATSCGGYRGADGALSLAEAIRLSNAVAGRQVITFAAPMVVSGPGSYLVSADVDLLAPPGAALDGKALSVSGSPDILIAGLEIRNQPAPMVFPNKTQIRLEDVWAHDFAGMQVYGNAWLTRVRMTACAGFCVQAEDPANADTVTVVDSEFEGGDVAVSLNGCTKRSGVFSLDAWASTFSGFATAIDVRCPGATRVQHVTFHANGTGVAYGDGADHVLRNAIFSGQTVAAATCAAAATFASRDHHFLFGNAAGTSCVTAADPGSVSGQDPLYVFEVRDDLRLLLASPARNTPLDLTAGATGLDLNGPAPGRFSGVAPDRGGREGE